MRNKILESETKIRFQDCDPFNHLNNSKYIDYFFNAREDQLTSYYDLDIYKHAQESGHGWVVASNQIGYLRPAFTMERICIETQLINYSSSSLQVEMRMFNQNKSNLKAIMWSRFVYFDMKNQKPGLHSQDFMDLFKSALLKVPEVVFDDRIKAKVKK